MEILSFAILLAATAYVVRGLRQELNSLDARIKKLEVAPTKTPPAAEAAEDVVAH
jgi:BMFP domain-containing protein YqiC